MKCPRCCSQNLSKNGRKDGKQRLLCKDCGRQFVTAYSERGYSDEFKQICIKEYLHGKSSRAIERDKKVHHTTVLLWVKQAGSARLKAARKSDTANHEITRKRRIAKEKAAEKKPNNKTNIKPYPNSASHNANSSSPTRAEKSEIILRSALEIFTARGYTAASMSRIAARAGVSKPTLYRYFKNKEGLFTVLIEQVLVEAQQNLFALNISPDDQLSLADVLRRLATVVLANLSEEGAVFPLMRLVIGESGRFPEAARMFVSKVEKPIFEKIATYLRFHPEIQTKEPMAMARIFIGTISHYLIVQNLLGGEEIVPLRREVLVEELVYRMTLPHG